MSKRALRCKYPGSPQEVTLAEPQAREPAFSPTPVAPLTTSLELNATGTQLADQVQERLLATKFFVPASPHVLIPRPHLDSLLHEGLRRQLTLVSAPAGFGKTTGLAHWIHSLPQETLENHRLAWISLDEADTCPVRFWTYVLTALNKSEPGVATPALRLLQAPHMPALQQVLTALINVLSQATRSYVLILDDFDLVDNAAVHASLSYLLEHQPPQLHLIILTRTDPPLNLPRLRARGQVVEIRSEQLRCTAEEAAAFLQEVIGIELPAEALDELIARSEGWLVGLQLLGLSLQARSDPQDLLPLLSGTHRYILDYLTEEVLRQQPAAVQRFLLHTSILERLSAPLCAVVTEQTDSQQMLECLERANLFVIPLDEQRHWYRYHALFAQALRARLEREDAEAIPALHVRASQWYEQQGQSSQAVQHALQAKAWQRAAALIEACTQTLTWRHDEVPRLLRWLEVLPAEVVRSRPRLSVLSAESLLLGGQLKAIEPWLEAAEAALTRVAPVESSEPALPVFTEGERQEMLGAMAALRAIVADYYGDNQVVQQQCQLAFAHLSEQETSQHATIAALQGLSALTSGKTAAATQLLREASALRLAAGSIGGAIYALNKAASCLQMQGYLHEAWQTLQQAVTLGTEPTGSPPIVVGGTYAYQADLLREWNQLDAALDLVLQGLRLAQEAGYAVDVEKGYLVLVRISLARGELDAAEATLQRAMRLPTLVDNPYRRRWLTAVEQVRVFLVRGEVGQATRWAERLMQEERLTSPCAREREDMARVRVLLARHQADEALTLLESLIQGATTTGHFDHVIEMRLLEALAHQMRKAEREALSALSQAVRLAEPAGYIRRFVDEGPPMATLLASLRDQQRRQGPTPYLDSVLAAFPQEGAAARPLPHQGLLDPLSERELEVLHLVAQGASNQEIADGLVLSVQTVKRHVYNILGKLQASNRTQAVMHAQSIGLLSEEQRRRMTHLSEQKRAAVFA